jgi:hypothetical protein
MNINIAIMIFTLAYTAFTHKFISFVDNILGVGVGCGHFSQG